MKILVLFYSMYGHIHTLAKAIRKGALSEGAQVDIKRVPETLSDEILKKMKAFDYQKKMQDITIAKVEDLPNYDAIIFGTPTRFGNMCAQMRAFLDSTGSLWVKGSLVGKVGAAFTSSSTQHGGQESTILTTHITLLHQGMIIVGLPYTFDKQMENNEVSGCSPYGVSTIAKTNEQVSCTETEIKGAEFFGSHIAKITKKLCN